MFNNTIAGSGPPCNIGKLLRKGPVKYVAFRDGDLQFVCSGVDHGETSELDCLEIIDTYNEKLDNCLHRNTMYVHNV